MELPFTAEQFFDVFATYNRRFIIVAMAFWIAAAAVVAAAWRAPQRYGRAVMFVLAALWLWNGLAYHALLFTRINPAAWLFAALFAVQAAAFAWVAARRRVEPFLFPGVRGAIGEALVLYSFAYPFLSLALGHDYPSVPTFAVPCPTALLAVGVLLTMRTRLPAAVALIPALWAAIGGSAAVLLDVWPDYALLIAAVALMASWLHRSRVDGSLAEL